MSAGKITAVGANIEDKTTMIWNVADMLRGSFKLRMILEGHKCL